MPNGDLHALMNKFGQIPYTMVHNMMRNMVQVLDYMQSNQIAFTLHAKNIFLTQSNNKVVMSDYDFVTEIKNKHRSVAAVNHTKVLAQLMLSMLTGVPADKCTLELIPDELHDDAKEFLELAFEYVYIRVTDNSDDMSMNDLLHTAFLQ